MGSLIAGIIVAAVGATVGAFGSLFDDARAREQVAVQRNNNNIQYILDVQKAQEEFAAAKEQADRNAAQAEKEADLTDQSLDVTEQGLSFDFNAAIDNMYLNQEADTMSWNAQAMQAGSSEGAAYASLGASGVRAGSSLSDAVAMESATNAAQLQFSQDAKRRSDNNNLGSVLNNLAGNKIGIQQNRIGADVQRDNAAYLRNSFNEGGHNWNLYANNLMQLQNRWAYNNAQLDQQEKEHSGWNSFINSMIALHGGAAKGFQTGYQIGGAFQNANMPKYGVDVGGGK